MTIEEKAKAYDNALKGFVDIRGYEGLYKLDSHGNIYSVKRSKLLRPGCNKQGYNTVVLCKEGKEKSFKVHRLVAITFIPNPNNYPCINHKDENKTNNEVSNLEWCTYQYNINYGTGIERRSETMKNDPTKLRKSVVQLSLSGNLVKEYRSTKEAAEHTGIDRRRISSVLNNPKRQAGGFLWIQSAEYDGNIDYAALYKKPCKRNRKQNSGDNPNAKPIAQYTKEGELIKVWKCIMDATRALKINYSTIHRCLVGYRKYGKGYIFKYL